MAIRIGYKASAEQFGPRELLEFSVEAEAVGYARRMADETHNMAEQLALDTEYSHVAVYEGDVSEEQVDPSHPSLVGMWWYAEEGAEWADAASLSASANDDAEPAAAAKGVN